MCVCVCVCVCVFVCVCVCVCVCVHLHHTKVLIKVRKERLVSLTIPREMAVLGCDISMVTIINTGNWHTLVTMETQETTCKQQ